MNGAFYSIEKSRVITVYTVTSTIARPPAGIAAPITTTTFFAPSNFRLRQTLSQHGIMAASSDRNPPPFPATEEPGAGLSDMADGDSDEGEDIFVSHVRSPPTLVVIKLLAGLSCRHEAAVSLLFISLTCIQITGPVTERRDVFPGFIQH